jgi:hypothetical protein
MRLCALVVATAGCHAAIAPGADATPAVDSTPACVPRRPILIVLDGTILTQAPTSDATQNTAEWLPVASAAVPAYRDGAPNRDAQKQQLLAAIGKPFPGLPIITDRPANGSFVLLAIGGTGGDLGFVATTNAASHLDCGDTNPNDVVWVSEALDTQDTADLAIGVLGVAIGLTGTMDSDDCLCGFGNSCVPNPTPCTLGTLTSDARCPGQTQPQDEVAAFRHAFCE